MVGKPVSIDNLDEYFSFLSKAFLNSGGFMWFNSFEYDVSEDKCIIRGFHDLGMDFSDFFADFIKYLMKKSFKFNLNESNQEITSHLINLEFKLEEKELSNNF